MANPATIGKIADLARPPPPPPPPADEEALAGIPLPPPPTAVTRKKLYPAGNKYVPEMIALPSTPVKSTIVG
jgi:hypothetical protein